MTDDEPQPKKRRLLGFYIAAFVLLLLAWLVLGVVVPHWRSYHRVTRVVGSGETRTPFHAMVESLGGPEEAVVHIERYLRLPEQWARDKPRATHILGACGPGAVPVLAKALRNENPRVRLYAAIGLGMQAKHSAPAVGALESALSDKDRNVRHEAAAAIKKLTFAESAKSPK